MPSYLYTSDDGDKKTIRLSAARATAAGFTAGTADDDDSVKVSKSNREFGQRPRGVRLSNNEGTDEEPNMKYAFLPLPTLALYNSATYNKGATVTIGGTAYKVLTKVPENNK